ncbi:MAG: hypothetical protein WAS54_05440 [Scrofimicrobium sp.]
MEAKDAFDALEQISDTKLRVSERSNAPKGYYTALGLGIAGSVAVVGLPLPWNLVPLVIAIGIYVVTINWYIRTVGMWTWGDVRGVQPWAFWALATVVAVALTVVVVFSIQASESGDYGTSYVVTATCAVVAFLAVSVLGPIWERAFVRQVRGK